MAFVATLTTEAEVTANPTWGDVEREICALDGAVHTLVVLAPPSPLGPPSGDHHLAIGGGLDGGLIVFVTEDNLTFWNLRNPENRGATRVVRMSIGGQEGDYRAAQIVSRDLALRAARRYVEDGQRAGDLEWTIGT